MYENQLDITGTGSAVIIVSGFDLRVAERGTFAVSDMRTDRGHSDRHNLPKDFARTAKLRKHSARRRTNALLDLPSKQTDLRRG